MNEINELKCMCLLGESAAPNDRMEPITDHMHHVSLNHRGAEAALAGVTAEARAAAAAAAAASGNQGVGLPASASTLKPALATEQDGETVRA